MSHSIQRVMFDLGVVLVHLDYGPAIQRALPLCDPLKVAHSNSFLSLLGRTPIVDAYERGEMTDQDFFAAFVQHTGFRGSFATFAEIWRSIFRENTAKSVREIGLISRHPISFLRCINSGTTATASPSDKPRCRRCSEA